MELENPTENKMFYVVRSSKLFENFGTTSLKNDGMGQTYVLSAERRKKQLITCWLIVVSLSTFGRLCVLLLRFKEIGKEIILIIHVVCGLKITDIFSIYLQLSHGKFGMLRILTSSKTIFGIRAQFVLIS